MFQSGVFQQKDSINKSGLSLSYVDMNGSDISYKNILLFHVTFIYELFRHKELHLISNDLFSISSNGVIVVSVN